MNHNSIDSELSDCMTSIISKKPTQNIGKLLEYIVPYGEEIEICKSEILRYQLNGKRFCYLLMRGSASLNRRGDGMIINSEHSPFIMGISNQFSSGDKLYIRALEHSTLIRLPLERFNLLIDKFVLWEHVCALLVYTASRVYEHCTMISQMSSYDIVKYQLNQLMLESPFFRANITAANYVKERTYLSRSGIMRIISDLRNAGYISLEKGVLININKLPLKY